MTYEEAINCIDDVLSADVHYDDSLEYALTTDDVDWLEMAKQALEKQIKKAPTHEATKPKDYTCPSCHNVIEPFYSYPAGKGICFASVCKHCGQALKWDIEEFIRHIE